PPRPPGAWLTLPPHDAYTAEDWRAVSVKAEGIASEPPPQVELRSVQDGKAQYLVSFWAADRDAALGRALTALRARFPQGEVHGGLRHSPAEGRRGRGGPDPSPSDLHPAGLGAAARPA